MCVSLGSETSSMYWPVPVMSRWSSRRFKAWPIPNLVIALILCEKCGKTAILSQLPPPRLVTEVLLLSQTPTTRPLSWAPLLGQEGKYIFFSPPLLRQKPTPRNADPLGKRAVECSLRIELANDFEPGVEFR